MFRFRAGYLSGVQVDLRLARHHKFMRTTARREPSPMDRRSTADVLGGLKKLAGLGAIFLCLVHGCIRILKQRLRIQTVVGIRLTATLLRNEPLVTCSTTSAISRYLLEPFAPRVCNSEQTDRLLSSIVWRL